MPASNLCKRCTTTFAEYQIVQAVLLFGHGTLEYHFALSKLVSLWSRCADCIVHARE